MKVILYGADICPDCVAAKARLAGVSGIELEFRDIAGSTATLREFLRHRDRDEMFAPVVEAGRIGIPFFILEDGTQTFELDDFLEPDGTVRKSACSLDGKGC
jgi:glutaredoxin-related protein